MIETYISIDVEADGPVPGLNSMLALGAAAFAPGGDELGTWSATLTALPEAATSRETSGWWQTQAEAWAEVTRAPISPELAMPEFVEWIEALPGKPVAAAWPAAFDFAFVNYYTHRFAGRNPLGYGCLDIRSLAQGVTRSPRQLYMDDPEMRAITADIDQTGLRSHVALDDAVRQGRLLVALLARVAGSGPASGDPAT